jgi:DUF438 domain-containing protein
METFEALDPALFGSLLDVLPVGVTVIDTLGRMLYYNDFAARIVNRKPEHLGRDIRDCHEKDTSRQAIDAMLRDLLTGVRQEVRYTSVRNGRRIDVVMVPWEKDGRLLGFVQRIIPEP